MRLAIPVSGGRLAQHFGHCEAFALPDVDEVRKSVTRRETVTAPAHQPGVLPGWPAQQGVTVVIAGGMGRRAQDLFAAKGIRLALGPPADTPEALVEAYLADRLRAGPNPCDH